VIPEASPLFAHWSFVDAHLPAHPASILEIGCGPRGGFVPARVERGHEALGVDPRAPAGSCYRQIEFEQYEITQAFDMVVACASLHHVAELGVVFEQITSALAPGGLVVIMEWAWERVDEATARWCFARLPGPPESNWLSKRRDEWIASGQPWSTYFSAWATRERLHSSDAIERELDRRFEATSVLRGPYFSPDLEGTSELEEQTAIDAGLIQATGMRYVGTRR
jgi:SAM-dependent methyltransferase